jgi:hypothetical protein
MGKRGTVLATICAAGMGEGPRQAERFLAWRIACAMGLLLIIVILLLIFGGGGGFYGYRRGYYGGRGHSLVWILLIVIVLIVLFGGRHMGLGVHPAV